MEEYPPTENEEYPKVIDNCYSVQLPGIYNTNSALGTQQQFYENMSRKGIIFYMDTPSHPEYLNPPHLFYSMNEILLYVQQGFPTATYDEVTGEFRITTTDEIAVDADFDFYYPNDSESRDYYFEKCTEQYPPGGNQGNFKNYFSNVLKDNQFTLTNGIALPGNCLKQITNDSFLIPGYIPSFDSAASILGSSKSEAISGGFYIGIGIGGNRFTKMTTFGVQLNWGNDKSEAMTALIDINGDGLEDIVSKERNMLYYKKHVVNRTYDSNNEVVVTHSFEAKRPISGIGNFYRSFGRSKSTNFQITYGFGFVGWDKSKSNSETDMFFTDGNGDGLMDIVRDGVVYFNRLDANQNPNFIPDSQGTENLVITAAPKTVTDPAVIEEDDIVYPTFDVVKVWEAPADGTIKIDNAITLTDPSPK